VSQSVFPEAFSIGIKGKLAKMPTSEFDGDPRGILWMWEPPNNNAKYGMGIDPSQGRTGWHRSLRLVESKETRPNNGAIEVFRKGPGGYDIQVAEYVAPVDPFELGDAANLIGRVYHGMEEMQCECVIEVYPGPGGSTLQRMLELGYTNFFRWQYYANTVAQNTKSIGWTASPRANRDLWVKASRHYNLKLVTLRSPWYVEECANLQFFPDQGWAESPHGEDDRVRAGNLALWMLNKWATDIEQTQELVRPNADEINWQATDMTMDEIQEQWSLLMDKFG
jgi:hypothetical protein